MASGEMKHPQRASCAPSCAPSRGPSPGKQGPVDPACPASGQAAKPGAACKVSQQPGEASSAAFAWFDLFHASRVARSAMDN